MRIYILRHGQAEPQQTTDDARKLTEKGRRETAQVLELALDNMMNAEGENMPLQEIWASPLVRAQQTAAIAEEFFPHLSLATTELLVPEARVAEVCQWLDSLRPTTSAILLVSHQPLVGNLVNQLCGVEPGFYPMATSSLAAIELDMVAPAMGRLLWLRHV